jgi:predicted small integral membrane protein
MEFLAEHFAWMAWTWQTALFFGAIAALLVVMTVLAARRPETPKVGILGFATTRSDRLFVSLLGSAFVYLLFIRFGGDNFIYPSIASLVLAVIMFRFA